MFPEMNEDLQNQILNINANAEAIKTELGRSFFFDFDTGQFVLNNGKLVDTGKEQTIKQWVSLCLRTYQGKYAIYQGTGFGTGLEKVIGKKLNVFYRQYIITEIQNGLLKNSEIKSIDNIDISKDDDKLNVIVNIKLVDGSTLNVEEVI